MDLSEENLDTTKAIKEILKSNKKSYFKLQSKVKDKFFISKEPKNNNCGFGYDTSKSLCLVIYKDRNGKISGEIIRKIDKARKIEPNYKKESYQELTRIYTGDLLLLEDGTKIKIMTFTEVTQNTIQVKYKNILQASNEQKLTSSFTIPVMSKYNPSYISLFPLGEIKYKSLPLK